MNKVILMGRLTRDPEVRYSQGDQPLAIARYSVAVDRRGRNSQDGQTADFINCVAFGRQGEFAEKYLHKGTKIALTGRIQTGSRMFPVWIPRKVSFIKVMPCVNGKKLTIFCIVRGMTSMGSVVPEKTSIGK